MMSETRPSAPGAQLSASSFSVLPSTRATPGSAAQRLRDYGLEAGIPSFFLPRQDWERVRVDKLLDAAKPVIGLWTHAIIPLAPGVDVALALDAPQALEVRLLVLGVPVRRGLGHGSSLVVLQPLYTPWGYSSSGRSTAARRCANLEAWLH